MEILTKRTNVFSEKLKTALFFAAVLIMSLFILFIVLKNRDYIASMEQKNVTSAAMKVGAVSDVQGVVFVTHKNAIGEKKLSSTDLLYTGDRVQTSSDGKAKILLNSGVELSLEQNSLIQMPETDSTEGGMLELESGNISVKGGGNGADLPSLQTPQVVIRLKSRNLVSFGVAVMKNGILREKSATGVSESYRYVETIYTSYKDRNGKSSKHIERMLSDSANACRTGSETRCIASLDAAWKETIKELTILNEEAPLSISVTVASGGGEEIKVRSGAVRVETGNRVLAIAKGDRISLKIGEVPTSPNVSDSALAGMVNEVKIAPKIELPPATKNVEQSRVKKAKTDEIYIEIDSMNWQ